MVNWNYIGQEWAVQMLEQHIAQNKVRHAYLFTGPPGIGRRTLALKFSMAISCKQPGMNGEPCGVCRACKGISSQQYTDLSIVQAEVEGGILKVDQIRDMQHTLSLSPYEGYFRIAMLLRFHEANLNAQNALLKTLEEAPERVILLLTADASEQLLPTIVSRCEVIRLRPLHHSELRDELLKRSDISIENAERISHLAGGRPGFALRLYQHPDMLEDRRNMIEDLFTLISSNRKERLSFASTMRENKDKLRDMIQTWLSVWRDVLLLASGCQSSLVNLDYEQQIKTVSEQVPSGTINHILSSLTEGIRDLDTNVNPELLVGVLALDFPHINISNG